MALQTFTAGQVLTAAQVTALQANDYNQTVNNYTDSRTLTIADLGDRVVMNKATATTITVNTGIFAAGDTLWIHNIGAGVCTITAGTATVSTSGSLVLAQNSGGTLYFTSTGVAIFFPTVASSAQGLTLLSTVSFSGVASQSFNNVFSATYDNYLVLFSGNLSTTASIEFRLRVGGVDNSTASSYLRQFLRVENTVVTGGRVTANIAKVGQAENNLRSSFELTIFNPFQATATPFTSVLNVIESSVLIFDVLSQIHNVTSSFDGFTLSASSGTITGSIGIYGFNK